MPGIAPRLVALALLAAGPAVLRSAAPPAASHPNLPAALAEAKALRVPALVVLTKPKATAAVDARITRMGQRFAAATVAVTPALTKQYGLNDDTAVLVLSADGEVVEKFAEAVAAEKVVAALKGHVDAARGELLKGLQPESSAKDKKAALAGLAKLGHRAEDLIPLLADADVPTREAAKKALAALPPDEAMDPLLAALKSDDAKLRAAVHPLAVAATGYKMSPLKVWQTGADDERAAAWEKWNDAVQAQSPSLNRAVLAYAEFSLGAKVTNGECSTLASEAFREAKAKPMRPSGETYVWGRELKPGEPVLPGDIAQFEKVKFTNGWTYPHHTAVVRKVLGPGQYETLQQNVSADKTVRVGKIDMPGLKEGTVVFYRPLPR